MGSHMNFSRTAFLIALLAAVAMPQQQKKQPSEFQQRTLQMLTPEQKAHMQANGKINRQEWIKEHPSRESTGLVALPDLGKGSYKGEQGGLYPGGVNTPPPAHLEAGLKLARSIAPLDAEGHPAAGGKIGLLSIGMSNTTMEFQVFQQIAAKDPDLNPRVAIVDGAQGGQTAKVTANSQSNFWKVVDERLAKAGVSARQVEVAWIKQANG